MDKTTLEKTFPGLSSTILATIYGDTPSKSYASVQTWLGQCYNMPPAADITMEALNEVLGGYGVEAIFREGELFPDLTYVNRGETYLPTLIYMNGEVILASWGDVVEQAEEFYA